MSARPVVYILLGVSTRLSISKSDIVKRFDQVPFPVFRQKDIARILQENRAFWRLAQKLSISEFTEFLLDSTKMQLVYLPLPFRPETLYTWGKVSNYVLASSAKPGAYLCHYTAMHLHGLTEQIPETIYANQEQRPLPPSTSPLTQDRIDAAFRRPQRVTSNVAPLRDQRLCLINGKHTGRLGVIEMEDDKHLPFSVTGLERTLIDITVRPYYAGGVAEVASAFKRAADRVSLNKLAAMLKQMDFVYPYEQAIGFYLQRAGIDSPTRLGLFRKRSLEHDFYLTYAMDKTEYSSQWRIHFPSGL